VRLQDKSGQFERLTTYLINLENRPDRLESAIFEAQKVGLQLRQIKATPATFNNNSSDLLSPAALACWDSHKRAMEEFLATEDSHCIIAEDDFLISNQKNLAGQIQAIDINDFDFLQIGFLNTGLLDRISRYLTNFESLIFISVAKIISKSSSLSAKYSQRLRVRRSYKVPIQLVADDIRAGAHLYLISRKFAEIASRLNDPAFLTADGFFMALAWDKHFKMARTRQSHVRQSNSPSSIKVTTAGRRKL
jgi:GR25 family glycosyltransferase involved in LPS biosynthesis